MGTIPYESQIDARTGRSGGARLRNTMDADVFGAAQGRAMQQTGNELQQTGMAMRVERKQNEREETLYNVATTDFTPVENELKLNMSPTGEGYVENVQKSFTEFVETRVAGIEDDNVRSETRTRLMAQLPTYTQRANSYAQQSILDTSKSRVNTVISATRNKVLTDPAYYDEAVKLSNETIDNYPDLPASIKPGMKQQNEYDFTKTRFEARLNSARTPEDFDAITAELEQPEWQARMQPRDFEDTVSKVEAAKQAIRTKAGAESRTLTTSLEERSKDPTQLIPQEELVEAQNVVAMSNDPSAQAKLARVQRNQQLARTYKNATPAQLQTQRDRLKTQRDNGTMPGAMPIEVTNAINEAVNVTGGDISAGYLDATIGREYGQQLKSNPGDYSVKNPTEGATATGIMQFTEGTFLKLVKENVPVQVALKINPTNMTDAQILELRTKLTESVIAGAMLAKQNKAALETTLGRGVTDAELYMAHFFGAPQAGKFIQATYSAGGAVAATMFPDEAAMNKREFYAKDGTPLTVAQVYSNMSGSFASSTTQVAYDDGAVLEKFQKDLEADLNGPNAMRRVAMAGIAEVPSLDQEGAFAARGRAWKTGSDYYGRKLAPFTADEEAYMLKRIDEGTTDDVIGLLGEVAQMGKDGSKAAFAQLKIKSPEFAQAGLLASDGNAAQANTVIRGYKRMKENPAIKTQMDITDTKVATDFGAFADTAFAGLSPADAQSTQDAAVAYMVEDIGTKGKKYDKGSFQAAIKAVTGNTLDRVNGKKTLLPKDTTPTEVEDALSLMKDKDWVLMSDSGFPPLHDGNIQLDPADADEIELRSLGGDKYYILDGSGQFLHDGTKTNGWPNRYVLRLTPERVKELSGRRQQMRAEAQAARARTAEGVVDPFQYGV